MASLSDTIFAPASGVGGAVAIVRVSGPLALKAVDAIASFRHGCASASSGGRVKFAEIKAADGSLLDEVLVAVFKAPHSYTGEDSAEIYCHASQFIVSGIFELLSAAGCRMAEPGEFTQRAFVNGRLDLAQAEAVADVIAASSAAEHRVAMNQMKGGYSAELRGIRDELLKLSALLELELDFSEEEVEFADRTELSELCSSAAAHCSKLADSFRLGNAVKNGVPVAIVGAPNSGKSTLLNALLGDDRAIVSDVPGTTRDTVEELCVLGGVKFRFVDTAGLRETSDVVEKMGIERSFAAIDNARIVLGVVDASSPSAAAEVEVIASHLSDGQSLIVCWNKSDLFGSDSFVDKACLEENKTIAEKTHQAFCGISAKTGAGLDSLREMIVSSAGPLDGSETLVTNARHAAALRACSDSLESVLKGLSSGLSGELVAEDLRSAIASLNTVLGDDSLTPQDTLNAIFSKFCIGK